MTAGGNNRVREQQYAGRRTLRTYREKKTEVYRENSGNGCEERQYLGYPCTFDDRPSGQWTLLYGAVNTFAGENGHIDTEMPQELCTQPNSTHALPMLAIMPFKHSGSISAASPLNIQSPAHTHLGWS
jgi:hypothetical protein